LPLLPPDATAERAVLADQPAAQPRACRGITADHPEDWTIEKHQAPAQSIANRIEDLMNPLAPAPALAHDPQ